MFDLQLVIFTVFAFFVVALLWSIARALDRIAKGLSRMGDHLEKFPGQPKDTI